MNHTFSAPVTAAQRQRDTLLGALVGLARSTVNEPKTEDTDRILAAGLRLAADPEAVESALLRMTDILCWQRTGMLNCCCPSSHGPRDCASSNFSRNKKAFPA